MGPMAANYKRKRRGVAGAPERPAARLMLTIPEDRVTRLIDPGQVVAADDAEIDAALTNVIDVAAGEIARALAETGRALAPLHGLRTAAEGRGYRHGYREGALATGWIVHALAGDAARPGDLRTPPPHAPAARRGG